MLSFLFILRKQDRLLTEKLDSKIAEHFPEFYSKTYKLETTEAEQEDLPRFIQQYVEQINSNNVRQGAGGVYYEHSTRNAATSVKMILVTLFEWFARKKEQNELKQYKIASSARWHRLTIPQK